MPHRVKQFGGGKYIPGTQRTAQGKDFELILTLKKETRGHLAVSFQLSAFVIIAEL